MDEKILFAIVLVGVCGNLLLMGILVMLKSILESIRDVDDNIVEMESTIERVSR